MNSRDLKIGEESAGCLGTGRILLTTPESFWDLVKGEVSER